jgi:hypothetical protein
MKALNPIALVANFIGVAIYLAVASLSWSVPEEAGLNPGRAGDAFVWL